MDINIDSDIAKSKVVIFPVRVNPLEWRQKHSSALQLASNLMRNTMVWCSAAAFLVCTSLSVRIGCAGEVTSEKVKSALSGLEKVVNQTQNQTGIPGIAIAVVHRNEVIYLKGFGVRQSAQPGRVDADTVFQLASVSKPIATTVIAAMVGEGRIDWDDRVIDYDPGFRLCDPWVTREVTFRDLLCHRSGLPDHAGDLLEDLGYGQSEVFRQLRYLNTSNNFRSKYAYTNFGFSEAAVAAARAAGTTWEKLCADKLYRPLGMKSTSSRFSDYKSTKNRALLHVRVNGQWVAKHVRDPDAQSPAGGVSSTVRDLAQWLRLQLADGQFDGKQIVAAAALDETHRPQIVSRPPENPADRAGWYALGWNVSYNDEGRVMLGHSGAFDMGAATVVNLLPAENLGIVVLTNAAPIGVAEAIGASYIDLVQTGKIERDWLKFFTSLIDSSAEPTTDYSQKPAVESPPLSVEAYEGTYRNAYFGEIEVIDREGALQLRMGPKMTPFPLLHWDRDVFIYETMGEMASGLSAVTFQIGTDLRATTVTVENLDTHGLGTFTRSPVEK